MSAWQYSKQHHTRFSPGAKTAEKHTDTVAHGSDMKAGLYVDREICHPFRVDWFSQGHVVLQRGTARGKYLPHLLASRPVR